jgi:hypothetical protein
MHNPGAIAPRECCGMYWKCSHILSCHAPRMRGIQYAAAYQGTTAVAGILDRPVEPCDDTEMLSEIQVRTRSLSSPSGGRRSDPVNVGGGGAQTVEPKPVRR